MNLHEWDVVVDSDGSYAVYAPSRHTPWEMRMPVSEYFEMMVENKQLKKEEVYQEIFTKQEDGTFKKEVKKYTKYNSV